MSVREPETSIQSDGPAVTQHRPIDQYENAAERARDVHIRDLDLPPRNNGHTPTEAVAYGEEMEVSKMLVCTGCGAVAGSVDEIAETECSR